MINKKNPELNPDKTKVVYFQLGLLVTSACVLMAFTWRSPLNEHIKRNEERFADVPVVMVEEIETPIVEVFTKPETVPQVPKSQIITDDIDPDDNTDSNPDVGVAVVPTVPVTIGDFDVPIGPAPGLEVIVEIPDKLAEFSGNWSKFLRENLVYPEQSKIFNEEGNVWVEFIVERDGSVTDVKVNPHSYKSKDLRNEAVRVVKSSPKWTPAMYKGEYVRTHARVKISFRLK